MTAVGYLIAGGSAILAGVINAVAGGGTLISFPVLMALGVPAIPANITNTAALCPGYFGGSWAQRSDLRTQSLRMKWILPFSALGGLLGGLLLINTGEKLFGQLVPFLILLASFLLALQGLIRKWLTNRNSKAQGKTGPVAIATIPIFIASVYGGYFGAGLGIIVLSVLGICFAESLVKLNALKQIISLAVNLSAASLFFFSGQVLWTIALIMAVGSLIGGWAGGKLAGKISPKVLRWTIVTIGIVIATIFFRKQFLIP